jgi:hypothetical protein
MGTIRARDAAALLGYGFLGQGGFSFLGAFFCFSFLLLLDVLGVFSVLTIKHAVG